MRSVATEGCIYLGEDMLLSRRHLLRAIAALAGARTSGFIPPEVLALLATDATDPCATLRKALPPRDHERQRAEAAARRAAVGISLLQQGKAECVWPLLARDEDPTTRSHIICGMARARVRPAILIERLGALTTSVDERQALILALGGYWSTESSRNARTLPVACLKPNDLGLFDMLGNAWEWCLDRRQSYPAEPDTSIIDQEDRRLVVDDSTARTRRGGSFTYDAASVRSACRGDVSYFPMQRRDSVGFRVARTLPHT